MMGPAHHDPAITPERGVSWCMQVPGTMDQVLLEWDGGKSMVLARVRDGLGCWLCNAEVHRKLASNPESTWYRQIHDGEPTS